MNGKATGIGIIAIIVIITLVAVAFTYAGGEEYWKTEDAGLGELREYIEVEYEDGEIQQLKILVDNEGKSLATVKYDGRSVAKFRYILSAFASGTGYSGVEVEPDGMTVRGFIKNNAGTNVWTESWTSSTNINKNLDVEFTIFSCEIPVKDEADDHSSWSGSHRCEFGGGGSLEYRGTGATTGDWESVTVTIYKNFYVAITQDPPPGSITLDIDESYTALQAVQ